MSDRFQVPIVLPLLPTEILERVFSYLNGQSLARCKQVCKLWNDIIENMARIVDIWKAICFREISVDVLRQLCDAKEIAPSMLHNCKAPIINWFSKYKLWFQGCYVKSRIPVKVTISESLISPIMCIKVTGAIAITGHRDGNIFLWDIDTGEWLSAVTYHLQIVTNLELVNILCADIYNVVGVETKHHHLISISKDHNIQICPLDCNNSEEHKNTLVTHNHTLNDVKVFGDCFVVSCMQDNTLSLWKMEPPKNPSSIMKVQLLLLIQGPHENVYSINFWQNWILNLDQAGWTKIYDIESQEWSEKLNSKPLIIKSTRQESGGMIFRKRDMYISKAFLFFKHFAFICTDSVLLMSVDGGGTFITHNPLLTLHSPVISVCYWGSILALGMENGDLHIYHVPDPYALLELDLANYNWSQNLSEASIIAVDIFDDGNGPVVVAASNQEIFAICWRYYMQDYRIVK